MQTIFRIQKALFVAFIAATCVVFAYALSFMTDYAQLFGLMLKPNAGVASFHDESMQHFNQFIFIFSLAGVCTIALGEILQLRKCVPDVFAVAVMCAVLAALAGCSVYVLTALPRLENLALTLDYSKLMLEGITAFEPDVRIFRAGMPVYVIYAAVDLMLAAVAVISHCAFVKGCGSHDEA